MFFVSYVKVLFTYTLTFNLGPGFVGNVSLAFGSRHNMVSSALVENMLRRSIDLQLARGLRIVSLDFGVSIRPYPTRYVCNSGWCDPVGAVILAWLPVPDYQLPLPEVAGRILDRDRDWMESLISGYNRTGMPEGYPLELTAWNMGRSLRKDYCLWRED